MDQSNNKDRREGERRKQPHVPRPNRERRLRPFGRRLEDRPATMEEAVYILLEEVLYLKQQLLSDKIEPKDWYDTNEAAALMGLSSQTVRIRCGELRLNSRKVASGRGKHGAYQLSDAEIDRFLEFGYLAEGEGTCEDLTKDSDDKDSE